MTDIVQEFGSKAMLTAIDANFAEEMMCFGRVLQGAMVHEGPEVWWFYTGQQSLNGVTLSYITDTDAESINEKITDVLNFFSARGLSTFWPITFTTQPPNMAHYLQARGFTQIEQALVLATDLHEINFTTNLQPSVQIEEIHDAESLQIQSNISKVCFEATPEGAQAYYECYLKNGFGAGKPWHHYLARIDGVPVGIASLLLHAGVAGIYGVGTLPEARGKGIGSALTIHTMREAHALGYAIAMLTPSSMGESLYRKIGFQDVGTRTYYLRSQS